MKDEIKEILQEIIDDIYQSGEYTYQAKKLEKVLDYITNLQEENDKLNKENVRIHNEYLKLFRCNVKALNKLYCYGEIFDSKILQQFQKEMENILQGEDKDE